MIERRHIDMKYYILYNPLAGNGQYESAPWLQSLKTTDTEIVMKDITALSDTTSYATFLSSMDHSDRIVICGGDGTLNRFINTTDGLTIHQDIYYYASGSGNDFLRDIGSENMNEPIDIKRYFQNLPTVEVNGKQYHFLNNVGFGIDGYCCEVGDAQKLANADNPNAKPINYTGIAIKGLLFHFKPCDATVTVDGREHHYKKVWLAPTMKGRYYGGGMMPTPSQDRNDPTGNLSIMIMHGSGKLHTLMVFPGIFKGKHITHEKIVDVHTGKDIRVVFDHPTALQIDGETILGVTEYHAFV